MSHRIWGLDLLRALAIFAVLIEHGNYILIEILPPAALHYAHWDGVSVFFVLSGFLIGALLLRSAVAAPRFAFPQLFAFWWRRWWRTLPAYFLVLGMLYAFAIVFKGETNIFLLRYLFFTQNLLSPHPIFFPEAWSLSVEEVFYLLFPLLFAFVTTLLRRPAAAFLLVICLFLAGAAWLRYYRWATGQIEGLYEWDILLRKQVFPRLDAIAFGCLGAWIQRFYPALWAARPRLYLWVGLFIFIVLSLCWTAHRLQFFRADAFLALGLFPLESCATLLLLPALCRCQPNTQHPVIQSISYVSRISYALYLLHLSCVLYLAIPLTMRLLPTIGDTYLRVLLSYALYWLYALLAAHLLYRYYEQPTTRLRDRWRPNGG